LPTPLPTVRGAPDDGCVDLADGRVQLRYQCDPADIDGKPSPTNVVVTFTGAVSGTMTPRTGFEPSCLLPFPGKVPPVWIYRVLGTVGVYHIVALEIGVDGYKGPTTCRNSAVGVTVGPIGTDLKTSETFRSTGNATLLVNADERSGKIEATLGAYPPTTVATRPPRPCTSRAHSPVGT
jgi:hypothetical protein